MKPPRVDVFSQLAFATLRKLGRHPKKEGTSCGHKVPSYNLIYFNSKISVKIFLIGQAEKLKQDAKINYQILKNCGFRIEEIPDGSFLKSLPKTIGQADLIIDAIFGVGLNRKIEEPFHEVIDRLNKSGKRILSVDIPSGLDGTTGEIYGICIRAAVTVTFTFPKKGFFKKCGPQYVGKLKVADIGIPKYLKKL